MEGPSNHIKSPAELRQGLICFKKQRRTELCPVCGSLLPLSWEEHVEQLKTVELIDLVPALVVPG
uniref:Uncharacterized protein n=1 Tax=Malurus cyaneus samueli TaxID=2593467 RepID=A0A8C5UBS2_9PASS